MEAEEWWEVPPPPPPPPSSADDCSGALHYCPLEGGPMGAHFNRASFPSLPIIAVCSSVVLVAVLVATFLLWRHKTKVQNLLPCKNEQQGHLGELGAANGITYEDVLINRHPTRIPQGHLAGSQSLMPLEILDVKLGDMTAPCYHPGRPDMVPPIHHLGGVVPKPFHHPVYEEVSQAPSIGGGDKSKSYETDTLDDEFPSREGSATSSVRGSTGGDLCRDPASSDEGGDWGRYASQENIYSTIDEDDLPLPPSLAPRDTKPLSQQHPRTEEGGSSYGDMMPAFHSATFM